MIISNDLPSLRLMLTMLPFSNRSISAAFRAFHVWGQLSEVVRSAVTTITTAVASSRGSNKGHNTEALLGDLFAIYFSCNTFLFLLFCANSHTLSSRCALLVGCFFLLRAFLLRADMELGGITQTQLLASFFFCTALCFHSTITRRRNDL